MIQNHNEIENSATLIGYISPTWFLEKVHPPKKQILKDHFEVKPIQILQLSYCNNGMQMNSHLVGLNTSEFLLRVTSSQFNKKNISLYRSHVRIQVPLTRCVNVLKHCINRIMKI